MTLALALALDRREQALLDLAAARSGRTPEQWAHAALAGALMLHDRFEAQPVEPETSA